MSSESGRTEKLGFADCTVPETNVTVYEALYRRRMAWDFKDQSVPKDALDRMLDTAVWAPNHRLTEPWRFFVLEKGSAALEKVAGLAHDFAMQRSGNAQRAEATRHSLLNTLCSSTCTLLPAVTKKALGRTTRRSVAPPKTSPWQEWPRAWQ